jgi:hypothetical protein
MLSSDSCIGIMEWSSGYLLSKHGLVRPKHGSSALLMELLDEEGGCLLGPGGGWGLRAGAGADERTGRLSSLQALRPGACWARHMRAWWPTRGPAWPVGLPF